MSDGRDWTDAVATLRSQLLEYYLWPEVGRAVAKVLTDRLASGAYRECRDEAELADVLTGDLQSVNSDPHLFVQYSQQRIPDTADPVVDDAALRAERAALTGHGFRRVERLPGNVALLEITKFFAPQVGAAGPAANAALALVASADALLIDLRGNTGGEPDMVAHVSGFLFDERTHLVDLVFPAQHRTDQYWTSPVVPSPAYGGSKPIWALIGPETFSAGEGFSYQLQQSGRAVLVGETTTPGPVTFHYPYRISDHLLSAVPSGYPQDPVSGRNWAGTGVVPDLAVPVADALDVAYAAALQHVSSLGTAGYRHTIAADARAAAERLARPPATPPDARR